MVDAKFIKAKEKFTKEIKSLLKVEDIVNVYISRNKSFAKYYPEILDFNEYLSIFKPKMAISKKDKSLILYNYQIEKKKNSDSSGNITNYYAPGFLGISEKVFKKILDLGLIKPTGYIEFRNWGKNLKTPYFDYDYLYKIRKEKLSTFILTIEGFNNPDEKKEWSTLTSGIINKYSLVMINKSWYRTILLIKIKYKLLEKININFNETNFKNVDIENLNKKIESILFHSKDRDEMLNNKLNDIIDINLLTQTELKQLINLKSGIKKDKLFKEVDLIINRIKHQRKLNKTEAVLDLKNYHNSFELARKIKRKINFVIGPTNSGKTFQALNALMKAETGVYLAPLRLMALEAYEKLNDSGIPCNLITGEESIIIEGAKHTSSTIECMDLSNPIECAIIDEIQMIADSDRGWAWTNALLGVPAKEVYAIGNISALNKSVELIKEVDDYYEVFNKQRLSSLSTLTTFVTLYELKKGDALIAFSKKQVLRYAIKLRNLGKKVSVIYGALSPEVRKKQAHLFSSGANDILVSTDAIGMGLNLPIDRVIFSTLEKYDGREIRTLNHTEIKQIGGRAGRFNSAGSVGILMDYNGTNIIKENLDRKEQPIAKFPISANKWHVSIMKDILKTNSIEKILELFPVLCNSDDFYSLENKTQLYIAGYIDNKFKIPATEKLKFCFTPIDIKSERQISFFHYIINQAFLKNIEIEFPKYNKFDKKGSFTDLSSAEEELKCMTIFKYLSKYSDNINLNGINERKEFLEEFIFKTLLTVEVPEEYRHREYFNEYFY